MSANQKFTLEFMVKMTGGPQAASQLNGLTNATKMNATETTKAAASQDKLALSQKKNSGEMTKATRNLRGLTFGLTGLVSSGVEAIGMWGIYEDSQKRVTEAQKEVDRALQQSGEGSKDYKDAVNELAQAERAMNMVRRNTILSGFDMVTWVTMTVNGLGKLGGITKVAHGITDKFKGAIGTLSKAFNTNTVALNGMEVGFQKAGKGAQFFGMSLKSIGIIAGISAVMGLMAVAIEHFTQKAEASGPSIEKLSGSIKTMGEELEEFANTAKEATRDFGLSVELASASVEIEKLTLKLGELKAQRDEILRPPQRGRAPTAINKDALDAIDKEIKSTQDLLDTKIDLSEKISEQDSASKSLTETLSLVDNVMSDLSFREEEWNEKIAESNKLMEATKPSALILNEVSATIEDLSFRQDEWNKKLDESNRLMEALKPSSLIMSEMDNTLSDLSFREDEWNKKLQESNDQIEAMKPSTLIMNEIDNTLADLSFSQDNWNEKIDESTEGLKNLQEFAKQSRIQLFAEFDVKTVDERREKFLDKIRKFLPNKIEKKIEVILRAEAKQEGFEQAAATFLTGLEKEILSNDTLANAVTKSIAKAAPDSEEGKELQKWLNSIIAGPDTGKNLLSAIQTTANGVTITIPAELSFPDTVVDTDPNSLGDDVKKALGIPTGGGTTKPVATVPVEGKIVSIDPTSNIDITNTVALDAIQTVQDSFLALHKLISSSTAIIHLTNTIALQTIGVVVNNFMNMANIINSTVPKIIVDNSQAMSAIRAVINEMAKVKDKTVTITTIRKTKTVSAAKGFEGLISTPTNFTVGEGSKPEWVSVIPMSGSNMVNRTETIMNRTQRPQTVSGSSKGDTHIHQVFINGEEFQRYQVRTINKNGGSFR